jgi:hypothetical protein
MAIYRESPSSRRLIPIVAVLVIGVLLIVVVAVVVISSANSNAPQPTVDAGLPAAAALDKIATSLDLFQIEYDKVKAGTSPNQTGAPGAITTALNTLAAAQSLSKLNKVAYTDLQSDLSTLSMAMNTSPMVDVTKTLADVQKQMKLLGLSSAPNTPATAAASH